MGRKLLYHHCHFTVLLALKICLSEIEFQKVISIKYFRVGMPCQNKIFFTHMFTTLSAVICVVIQQSTVLIVLFLCSWNLKSVLTLVSRLNLWNILQFLKYCFDVFVSWSKHGLCSKFHKLQLVTCLAVFAAVAIIGVGTFTLLFVGDLLQITSPRQENQPQRL